MNPNPTMTDPTPKPVKEDVAQTLERVFLSNDILPDAAKAFCQSVAAVEEAIKSAVVVLDTNVLLLPYGAGAGSLKHVIAAFKTLKQESRLFLPGQVVREFIKNRPNKLSELQQGLSDKISRFAAIDKLSFPILEGVKEYQQLNESLQKTNELKSQLSKVNSALLKTIRSWEWNDPVNSAYKEVFTTERIVEPKFEREEMLTDLIRRQRLSIPPGYKDSAKEDMGIGDLLIWKTILEIGSTQKKDIVFVSGDEKADWQHRATGSGFLPRYELLDEYSRASSGKSFYIVPLSRLLELLKVESASIAEIKQEEKRIHEANTINVECPYCDNAVQSRLADHLGASAKPYCSECWQAFHVHRTSDGITIHKTNHKANSTGDIEETRERVAEFVSCPRCTNGFEAKLGAYRNATSWCSCSQCNAYFPIHRKIDGGVFVGRNTRIDGSG